MFLIKTRMVDVRRSTVTATLAVLMLASDTVLAGLIDFQLVVNPVQICRDASTCANAERLLYEEHTDLVWSQAGIDVRFLDTQTFINPTGFRLDPVDYGRMESGTFRVLDNWYDSAPGSPSEPNVVNMFFVGEISVPIFPGGTAGGIADFYLDFLSCAGDNGGRLPRDPFVCADNYYESVGNFAIADRTFDDSSELVIAHEIGHVLGLHHPDEAVGSFSALFPGGPSFFPEWVVNDVESRNPANIMLSQARVSADLDQLPPFDDFAGLLSAAQISVARQSAFLIPFSDPTVNVSAPSTLPLLVVGVLLLSAVKQRTAGIGVIL